MIVHFKVEVWSVLGFPGSSVGKESACNAGDPSSFPGLGRSAGEGIGYPLQYSLASLVAQLVKNPPAIWETWVQTLGWEDSLEKGMATHSSGHLMRRADSFEKTLMLGKIKGRWRRGWQRMRRLDGISDSVDMSLSKLWGLSWTGWPGLLWSMGSQSIRHDWVTELNWTDYVN